MSALTPTEDLAMEVLAARARCGESLWTFDRKHKAALQRLAGRGLVNLIHGVTQDTVRASLTDRGRADFLADNYVPPIREQIATDIERMSSPYAGDPFKVVHDAARLVREGLPS